MARVMMALGEFRFSIGTAAYQSLTRSASFRWSAQERIGRAPALQFMGPGEETIQLEGAIFPQYRGGAGQVEAMRIMAGKGEPLTLVDGRGRYWGSYVIRQVGEAGSAFLDDGAARKIEFSLELARYGDDDGATPPVVRR